MSQRWLCRVLVAILALVALTLPATAGGFAVVHLDKEPADVPVATPWRVGFTVLQHDVTPNSDVTPVLWARHKATGEEVSAIGIQEGAEGHFVAELTLPLAGEWKWSIEPRPFAATSFATLVVVGDSATHAWPTSIVSLFLLRQDQAGASSLPSTSDTSNNSVVDILDPWVFSPHSLEVEVGTTVTWFNRSETTHVVTGYDLAFDDSGPIAPGASFTATFDQPGTYLYECSPHPGMKGEVIVR